MLPHIHPALGVSKAAKKILPHIAEAIGFFHKHKITLEEEKMVWFQALLAKHEGKGIEAMAKRLMLSRVEQKIVTQSAKAYPTLLKKLSGESLPVSHMYKLLCPLRSEVQCFLLAAAGSSLKKRLAHYFLKVQKSVPWIRGRDLQDLGIPAGFRYSFILLEALNAQLDDKFKNRRPSPGVDQENLCFLRLKDTS